MRRQFLTPDASDINAASIRRFFVVSGNLAKYLTGAIDELTDAANWQPFGSCTPTQSAEYFEEVIGSMGNMMPIGTIYYSLAWKPDDCSLAMTGQFIANGEYPDLETVIPLSWRISGGYVLPDMGMRGLVGDGKSVEVGDAGGETEHVLTVNEMPSHNHGYVMPQSSAASMVLPDVPTAIQSPGYTEYTGGGLAHNNMQPYLVANCYIVAK